MQPYMGKMNIRHGLVIWELSPDEAREIADCDEEALIESGASNDLAYRDVAALRYWANLIDNKGETK